MKIKCDYCGAYISDTDEKCPNCGGVNSHLQRKAVGTPSTIEELKTWYKEHNLPPEDVTRFFIGTNYTKPKAFGIYKDEISGNFVVYKNKSDGSRSIRYEGKDEAYAVNELYLRLKEEIVNQKRHINHKNKANRKKDSIFSVIFFIIIICMIIYFSSTRQRAGYYLYDDIYYYYQRGTWYEYDDYYGWYESYAPEDLEENYSDYYESSSYYSTYGIEDFSDTDYYIESSSSDSDWDSSWDSGSSWDSSSTDWSSDW